MTICARVLRVAREDQALVMRYHRDQTPAGTFQKRRRLRSLTRLRFFSFRSLTRFFARRIERTGGLGKGLPVRAVMTASPGEAEMVEPSPV
jgi:hypothetical protein